MCWMDDDLLLISSLFFPNWKKNKVTVMFVIEMSIFLEWKKVLIMMIIIIFRMKRAGDDD